MPFSLVTRLLRPITFRFVDLLFAICPIPPPLPLQWGVRGDGTPPSTAPDGPSGTCNMNILVSTVQIKVDPCLMVAYYNKYDILK